MEQTVDTVVVAIVPVEPNMVFQTIRGVDTHRVEGMVGTMEAVPTLTRTLMDDRILPHPYHLDYTATTMTTNTVKRDRHLSLVDS